MNLNIYPSDDHIMNADRRQLLVAAAFGLAACACLGGCSAEDGPQTIAVNGRVTFDGGVCPGAGDIRFTPVSPAANAPRRPGYATFGTDGRFLVRSFKEGDGLVPGTYRVRIECWKKAPAMGNPGISHMPAGFPPFELRIGPDARGPVEVAYDVTSGTKR